MYEITADREARVSGARDHDPPPPPCHHVARVATRLASSRRFPSLPSLPSYWIEDSITRFLGKNSVFYSHCLSRGKNDRNVMVQNNRLILVA